MKFRNLDSSIFSLIKSRKINEEKKMSEEKLNKKKKEKNSTNVSYKCKCDGVSLQVGFRVKLLKFKF